MPKYDIEIIERLRDGTNIMGPMEDLTSDLFTQVNQIAGCTLEIYPDDARFERINKINPKLVDPAANRIIQIVNVPLLATVLMGLIRRQPRFGQLHAWLTQGGEHDRSEFWLREVEQIDALPGPECLSGPALFEALQDVPAKCDPVNPSREEQEEVFDFEHGEIGEKDLADLEIEIDIAEDDLPGIPLENNQGYLLPVGKTDLEENSPIMSLAEVTTEEVDAVINDFFDHQVVKSDEIWLEEVVA